MAFHVDNGVLGILGESPVTEKAKASNGRLQEHSVTRWKLCMRFLKPFKKIVIPVAGFLLRSLLPADFLEQI